MARDLIESNEHGPSLMQSVVTNKLSFVMIKDTDLRIFNALSCQSSVVVTPMTSERHLIGSQSIENEVESQLNSSDSEDEQERNTLSFVSYKPEQLMKSSNTTNKTNLERSSLSEYVIDTDNSLSKSED